MKKILFTLLLLAGGLGFAQAAPMDLTVDQAIQLALTNNPAHQVSQQEIRQYRYRLMQNFGFLPEATLSGSKILDQKLMTIEIPSFIPGGEPTKASLRFQLDYSFSFQIVQPVFTGGKIYFNYKNAELDLRLARERERSSRADTILGVRKAFYNIQILQELLKAHQEALALAEANFNNVKNSFDLGMASQYDLLRAELALSAVKPDVLRVENLLETSRYGLKLMLGLPREQDVRLQGVLGCGRVQLELAGLLQSSLQNRSELRQLQMQRQKIANLQKITWAQYVPNFSLVANFSYQSDYFKLRQKNWDDYYSVSLGMSWPIFTGLKRSAQIGEMNVMKKIMDLNVKQLGDATRLEVESQYRTIHQEYENIQMGLKNVESAREGARIAELSYKEGMITILELNSSYNELTRARVNYLQALYNYNIAIAELEKVTGIDLNGGVA
ncbi:MAG: TolC family protein [Acidobacteria bacterium]|jgi:outer membrane protein TolC|nr:TolC family protein [Acidobacteriota bacterium]